MRSTTKCKPGRRLLRRRRRPTGYSVASRQRGSSAHRRSGVPPERNRNRTGSRRGHRPGRGDEPSHLARCGNCSGRCIGRCNRRRHCRGQRLGGCHRHIRQRRELSPQSAVARDLSLAGKAGVHMRGQPRTQRTLGGCQHLNHPTRRPHALTSISGHSRSRSCLRPLWRRTFAAVTLMSRWSAISR